MVIAQLLISTLFAFHSLNEALDVGPLQLRVQLASDPLSGRPYCVDQVKVICIRGIPAHIDSLLAVVFSHRSSIEFELCG